MFYSIKNIKDLKLNFGEEIKYSRKVNIMKGYYVGKTDYLIKLLPKKINKFLDKNCFVVVRNLKNINKPKYWKVAEEIMPLKDFEKYILNEVKKYE